MRGFSGIRYSPSLVVALGVGGLFTALAILHAVLC